MILGNIFKSEDPKELAKIMEQSFVTILLNCFKGLNVIDVKLVAKRYEDKTQINYKRFIQEVQQRTSNAGNIAADKFGLQPGTFGQDQHSEIGVRLKSILRKINDFTV